MSALGDYVKERRRALQKKHAGYSIRNLASRIGIHHSYLSKLERGEHAPLSEARIMALSRELGDDPENLLALSGRLSERIVRLIRDNPGNFLKCLLDKEKKNVHFEQEMDGYTYRLAQRKKELEELIRHLRDEIQERRRLLVILEQNDLEQRTILENLKDTMVLYLDRDMRIIWLSSSISKQLGRPLGRIKGKQCFEVFRHRSSPCASCTVPIAINTGLVQEEQSQLTERHGQQRCLLFAEGQTWIMRSIPILDEEKNVYRVVRFGFNITELEKTRQALEESERRWKFALEGANEGLWDWNIQTNKVFFSRRWKEMLGFSEYEIEDDVAEWESRIHPDDYEKTFEALNNYLSGETESYDCEHRLLCKDGKYKWIRDRGVIMQRDDEGKPLRAIGTHFDVTEQREIEEKLRQNEGKYRTLYKKTPAMFHSIDPQGRIISVSDQWLEKMGYHRDEVIGKPTVDFLAPESRERALQEILPKFFEKGQVKDVSYQMVTKQGKIIDIVLSAEAEYDDQGRVLRSLAILTDISEKKRIEEDLLKSKEYFQAVVRDTPALICRFEPNGIISYANKAYCEFFEKSEAELIGTSFLELIPLEQRDFVWQKFTSLTPEKPVASYDHQAISPTGQIHWQRWTDRAIFNFKGYIEAYQSVGIDITEEISAKNELQKKTEEQGLLLDCIPVQIWYLTDLETYGRVNQAHADFLGLPKSAIENRKLDEFVPQEVAQNCKQGNEEVFALKRMLQTQEWVPNGQGEERLLKVVKNPKLSSSGKVEYIVCSATDITEQFKLNS